jgi:hypothetical protein
MSNQNIQQLAEQAFKYGPFFFSVLFVIFLTRWAYKKYSTAIAQVPAIEEADKKINRTMFMSTFFMGLALVVVSVIWWWWFKPGVYLFVGKIQNLQPQEEVAADLYYLKREYRGPISEEDTIGQLRNEEFVILRTSPFRDGQSFALEYSKNHKRREKLWITYERSGEEPVYEVDYDASNQRAYLKRVSQSAPPQQTVSLFSQFEKTVEASEFPQGNLAAKQSMKRSQTEEARPIAVLQDPRSNIAAKLDAIDTLTSKSQSELRKYLELNVAEPVALTIFDLTQHSDEELASKAASLAQKADIDGFLIEQLSSQDQARRQTAEKILFRISRTHAQALLKRANRGQFEDLRRTSQEISSGAYTQILKPTAASDGDRYYVKATWKPEDPETVSCLTKLFNSELYTKRTLSEEAALMQRKSQRFVYWYSKDWAIDISTEIKKCGGQAEFVKAY